MKKFFSSVSLLGIVFSAVLISHGTAEAAARSSASISSKPAVQQMKKSAASSKKAALSSKKASKSSAKSVAKQSAESCVVLGNIGDKKEKIFHVPGCPNYKQTKIETAKGERIFCSESDAIAAGWRKAKNCPN